MYIFLLVKIDINKKNDSFVILSMLFYFERVKYLGGNFKFCFESINTNSAKVLRLDTILSTNNQTSQDR